MHRQLNALAENSDSLSVCTKNKVKFNVVTLTSAVQFHADQREEERGDCKTDDPAGTCFRLLCRERRPQKPWFQFQSTQSYLVSWSIMTFQQ